MPKTKLSDLLTAKPSGWGVWFKVESTNIKQYRYNSDTKELEIVFIKSPGTAYTYTDVPTTVFNGLRNAGSVGSYFHAKIRNVYSFKTREFRGEIGGGVQMKKG